MVGESGVGVGLGGGMQHDRVPHVRVPAVLNPVVYRPKKRRVPFFREPRGELEAVQVSPRRSRAVYAPYVASLDASI